MLKAGITGGIGSGKTIISNVFKHLGIPVYHADDRAKILLNSDAELIRKVKQIFGEESYHNGNLQRELIAEKVFGNKEKLEQLNRIVHPAVANDYELWLLKNLDAPYTLKEAAILIESGAYKEIDFIILVTAPEELRIQRVMNRDKINKEQVVQRLKHQMTEKEKIEFADAVIINDDQKLVIPQVLEIHSKLLSIPGIPE